MTSNEKSQILICPSLLSADFSNLEASVQLIEAEADFLHLDVMDGHYVPNLTFGPMLVKALRKKSKLFFDTHLMVSDPDRWLEAFAEAGSDSLVVHVETLTHGHRTLARIHELGLKAGISLNPGTPLSLIEEYIPYIDLLLIMTVNPGFGGQSYIESMNDKIKRARKMIDASNRSIILQVDGGISRSTIARPASCGANAFVSGSACFGAADPAEEIRQMRLLAESVR